MQTLKLVSLPWRSTHHAPIDLGSLAAYVQTEEPTYSVDVCSAHLDAADRIGVLIYDSIALKAREEAIGDGFYSAMLWPGVRQACRDRFVVWAHMKPNIKAFVGEYASMLEDAFDDIFGHLHEHLDSVIEGTSWDSSVVGLPTTYNQLFSSIEFANRLKDRSPDSTVVLGGVLVSGPIGASIIREFPWIDYVVRGEGELPLVGLLRQIEEGEASDLPAVLARTAGERELEFSQLRDINDLPIPDFDAYYASPVLKGPRPVGSEISIEASRGCGHTCGFCNFHSQWSKYRIKAPDRVVEEMVELSNRYGRTRFHFMDNNLTGKYLMALADALEPREHTFRFTAALRADVRPFELLRAQEAGLVIGQLGIEGFSSSYLRRMNKGTTVIQNLEAMKTLFELGVKNAANLIIDYPGCTQAEADETYQNLMQSAIIYEPLETFVFRLHIGAPVHAALEEHCIERVRNNDWYKIILPLDVAQRLDLYDLSWDFTGEQVRWEKVLAAVDDWQEIHRRGAADHSLLTYYDTGTTLYIEDYRGTRAVRTVDGPFRDLYLYCTQIRTHQHILKRFADNREGLEDTLSQLVEEHFIFEEDGRYLSLAVAPDRQTAAKRIRDQHAPGNPPRWQ